MHARIQDSAMGGGGQCPIFDDGVGQGPQISKFPQNHKGPPNVKIGTSDLGGMAPLPPVYRPATNYPYQITGPKWILIGA